MKNTICPCINCLIYPICNAKTNEYLKIHLPYSDYKYDDHIGIIICSNCSLVQDWVNNNNFNECCKIISELYIKGYNKE